MSKVNPLLPKAKPQGSRKALTWGQESCFSPLKCLPDSANSRALGNETSLVKLNRHEYSEKASTEKGKGGAEILCVLSNGISLPTDHNMRALNHNVKQGPTKLGTLTLQQYGQLKNAPEVYRTMVKNQLIVGNFGRSYEVKENNKSYNSAELEGRVGNHGLRLMDIPFKQREKEDNTINNIDRAINPGAVAKLYQKFAIAALPSLSTWYV